MKAIAKCPKCKEIITTDCEACIDSDTSFHKCKGKKEADIVKVKWKKISETEKDLETN